MKQNMKYFESRNLSTSTEIKMLLKRVVLSILFLALMMGCSPNQQMEQLFVDGQERIQLLHQTVQVNGKEQVTAQGYTHPFEFGVEGLEALLSEISVNKYALFQWSDAQPLFYEEEIKKLAPRLAAAFQKATSDQWIYFSVTAEKPGMLIDTLRLTDGICFLEQNKLNFIFNNINVEIKGQHGIGLNQIENDFRLGDPRQQPPSQLYRFVFQPQKSYSKPRLIEGDPWLSREQSQWLIFDVTSLPARRPATADVSSSLPPKTGLSERLKTLKELHEQELITDQEYEAKRKEILKEL